MPDNTNIHLSTVIEIAIIDFCIFKCESDKNTERSATFIGTEQSYGEYRINQKMEKQEGRTAH